MLKIDNLVKRFGNFTAVNNLSLHIKSGDLYGFLGPNGAGKTTTIKMIVGLYSISQGSINIDDLNITDYNQQVKYKFGYIPDQPFLYDKLTGLEYLYFCGGLFDLNKKHVTKVIDELVDLLKIEEWLYKRTEDYSQGMRQRISIASAFLHDPMLIIIDEPMVGLDPQSAHIIKKVLVDKANNGKTIFMSTHSLNVVEEICNRVGIIKSGEIIFDNSIENLTTMKSQHNPTLEQLFIELTND